jgi:hypothetical protein
MSQMLIPTELYSAFLLAVSDTSTGPAFIVYAGRRAFTGGLETTAIGVDDSRLVSHVRVIGLVV